MKKTHMTEKRSNMLVPTVVAGAVVLMLGVMAQPVYAQATITGTIKETVNATDIDDSATTTAGTSNNVENNDTVSITVTGATDLTVTDSDEDASPAGDADATALTVTGGDASESGGGSALVVTGGTQTDTLTASGVTTLSGNTVIGTAAVAHTGVDGTGNPTGGSNAIGATLAVTGNVTIGTAAVAGTNGVGQINELSAHLTVNGNSTTTGTSTLGGDTTIGTGAANANLTVNGNSTTTGTSTLGGDTTIGTTMANANLTVNGNTTLNGTTTINGTINVGGNNGADVEFVRNDGNGILIGQAQTQLRGGSSSTLSNEDAALLTLGGHNASLVNRTGHGVVISQDSTVISGGTTSTSLALNNDSVRFSNGNNGSGGPVKVTGIADGTAQYDAVNFGQLQDLERDLSKGIAATTAAANIPQVAPGKAVSVGAGLGGYNGETAVAVGLHYRLAENAVVRATVATGGKKAAYGLGAAFSW